MSLKFFVIFCFIATASSYLIDRGRTISLYHPDTDDVIELTDANITDTVFSSRHLWVVEFYAHWCGYCIKFSKIWKQLAEELKEWDDMVKVGAINCAQQSSCNNFNVIGTPTLRIFYPGASSGKGYDIMISRDPTPIRVEILRSLEIAQRHQLVPIQPRKNLLPYSSASLNDLILEGSTSGKVILIIEDVMTDTSGLEVIFWASQRFRDFLVRRIDWRHANIIGNFFQHGVQVPAVFVLEITRGVIDWSSSETFYPIQSDSGMSITDQVLQYLESVDTSLPPSTTTTPAPTPRHVQLDEQVPSHEDLVYMSDLERSIEYALNVEIPTQAILDEVKMKAVFQYLDVIIRFLPLRDQVRSFLINLRDWPIMMNIKKMKSNDFKTKVDELTNVYKPFEDTPEDWQGCKGSESHFRGYPCSVWMLFHTLTVNAAMMGDPSMKVGGQSMVARSMVSYIYNFFTCSYCAENFSKKVKLLGFLPSTPYDSIMWLWRIHNMANEKLRGDASEDPNFPKIIWPSPDNCPQCRVKIQPGADIDFAVIEANGETWNARATTEYIMNIYMEDSIIPVPISNTRDDRLAKMKKEVEEIFAEYQSQDGLVKADAAVLTDKIFNYIRLLLDL